MQKLTITTPEGDIAVEPRQYASLYIFQEEEANFQSPDLERVLSYIWPDGGEYKEAARIAVLQAERSFYRAEAAAAKQPKSTEEMLVDLSNEGVEVPGIIVPCQGDDCSAFCSISLDEFKDIAEVAAEAAELEGHDEESFLCGVCKDREALIDAQDAAESIKFEAQREGAA